MAKLAGQFRIVADGVSLRSKPDAELDMGGFNVNFEMADFEIDGYVEEPVPSEIRGTIVLDSQQDLVKIRDIRNGVILFQSDNGLNYLVNGAVCAEPPKLKGSTGGSAAGASVVFRGKPALQQK